MKLVLFFCRRY